MMPVVVLLPALAVLLLALRPVADLLLRPLERQHPPLDLDAVLRRTEVPRFVVVLAAGDRHRRPELPATAQLQPSGLTRLVEGIRIVRRLPDAHLLACVFSPNGPDLRSPIADAAHELGVDRVVLASSADRPSTRSELAAVKAIVSAEPFILVTSAAHMPRAVALSRSLELHPLPAPTDFMARRRPAWGVRAWRPTIQALSQSERALQEYGAWVALRLSSR